MPSRILVLEADPTRQVFFRAALASAGYAAHTAADPAEATDQLRTESFRLVLLGPEVDPAATVALRQGEDAPPLVKVTMLPDCVIGEVVGGSGPIPRELPGILEALTRYIRFAPPLEAGKGRDQDELLRDWSEFERRSAG
jgi:hypothetical protein